MLALVVAGEAVFALPFVLARVFRPTLLDVLGITHLQLGAAMSVYGVVAMLSYFPGGPLADRFGPRRLMAVALALTALGGVYYGKLPSAGGLSALFGYWGCTTILLFWAPLIRATRRWGGADSQGRAYGLLDGGRGLFAAVLATASLVLFGALMPDDPSAATLADKTTALRRVIGVFTLATLGAALLVWLAIPREISARGRAASPENGTQPWNWAAVIEVLGNRRVWLQGAIVVCAYVGYKGIDDLGLMARDMLGADDVQAARIGAIAFWARPFAALGAGLLGDKIGGSRAMILCFAAMLCGYGAVAAGLLQASATWTLFIAVIATASAVYGLRGLYFAVFAESGVRPAVTGTAAGIVSVVGYTPDVFMGPLMGWCTDSWPGATGHRVVFAIVAGFAAAGIAITALFVRLCAARKVEVRR